MENNNCIKDLQKNSENNFLTDDDVSRLKKIIFEHKMNYIEHIYLPEPPNWNSVRVEQVIGRRIRNNHIENIKECNDKKNIKIKKYSNNV